MSIARAVVEITIVIVIKTMIARIAKVIVARTIEVNDTAMMIEKTHDLWPQGEAEVMTAVHGIIHPITVKPLHHLHHHPGVLRANATVCFLLLLVFLGNSNFAAAECWETTSSSPICVGFLCKGTCWIGAKVWKAKVKKAQTAMAKHGSTVHGPGPARPVNPCHDWANA
uniref:Uncharacterized protein n=1 Tax=Oryza punctata TaxID=4537 RepID=A0A0E0L081_ORYPU